MKYPKAAGLDTTNTELIKYSGLLLDTIRVLHTLTEPMFGNRKSPDEWNMADVISYNNKKEIKAHVAIKSIKRYIQIVCSNYYK